MLVLGYLSPKYRFFNYRSKPRHTKTLRGLVRYQNGPIQSCALFTDRKMVGAFFEAIEH